MSESRVIETRYRDIPWEELNTHHKWTNERLAEEFRPRWPLFRGKAVKVRAPADNEPVIYGCTQPRYAVVNADGSRVLNFRGKPVSLCSCIAELGD